MFKSIAELKAEGWTPEQVPCVPGYPACDHIVLTDGKGSFLCHVYAVYDDSSDYPADTTKVSWKEVEIYEVTVRRVRDKNHGQ